MPVTIHTGYLNVRDDNGEYIRYNTVAEETVQEMVEDIEAKGAEVIASIPGDYTALSHHVDDLQDQLYGISPDVSWEQGSISLASGNLPSSDASDKIRTTDFIGLNDFVSVICATGYVCAPFCWDSSNGYLGWYRNNGASSGFTKSVSPSTSNTWSSIRTSVLKSNGASKVKLVILKSAGGDLLPTDGANILLNGFVKDKIETVEDDIVNGTLAAKSWHDICNIIPGSGLYGTGTVDSHEMVPGDTISTTISSNSSFGCQLVSVHAGDKFKVSGRGAAYGVLWAFTNTSYVLIEKAPAFTTMQTNIITARYDGFLFINVQTSQATYSVEKWQIEYVLKDEMSAVKETLFNYGNINIIEDYVFYRIFATNGGVGTIVDFTGSTSQQFGSLVDECEKGQKYKITGQGGASPRLWCFVDNDNKIQSVAAQNVVVTTPLEITAPTDGKLIFQASLTAAPYSIVKENAYESIFVEKDMAAYPFTGFDMFRTIAGLGDSYTEGDLVTSGGNWTTINGISYLGSIARRNDVTASNYGSGGTTTKTYLSSGSFAHCLEDDPSDLYMICFGINDAAGSTPMTVGTTADIHDADYTQNPDTFYGNYGRIMSQLMAHAPNSKYILIMPWPTGNDYSAYNSAVADIAAHYSIPYINPSDDPFFTSYFWRAYKSSGHPVAMTYAGMGRAVERLFDKCVRANPTYFKYAMIG